MSMTWREFEIYCGNLIKESLDPKRYRIAPQYRGEYAGKIKCMDFHIAERRQGGRSFVVDCKHFQKSRLNNNEVNTTIEYKRLCRASGSIILVSSISECPPNFLRYAKENNVKVIPVDIGRSTRNRFIQAIRGLLGNRESLNLGLPDY